jgi:hypothetical protein
MHYVYVSISANNPRKTMEQRVQILSKINFSDPVDIDVV